MRRPSNRPSGIGLFAELGGDLQFFLENSPGCIDRLEVVSF